LHAQAGFRPDIEGLRGVAILSVFAVHSIPDSARGGFIGVDVFFVLSGYLIASITLRELAAGHFSVAGFYQRRLRRLLPALVVVLLACLTFAVTWAIPADAKAIGKHVAAGAAFVSNLALWAEAGYFDPSSELKPLLHLWSLGIEEQFYLLWPLLALLFTRARRWVIAILVSTLLLSFMLNVAFVASRPKAVFFLPLTRFWEMLIGVVLATWTDRVPGGPVATIQRLLPAASRWRPWIPDLFAGIGVVLLLVAIGLIAKTDRFPGLWALLPTIGTFLLLAAGMRAWVNRTVLSQPVLMFYGRISYPLYLWHWPLLTFPVLLNVTLDWLQQTALLVLAVGLAVLTTLFVEQPFRFGRLAPRAPLWLGGALAGAGCLGGVLFVTDGLVGRYPERVKQIAQEQLRQDPSLYRLGTCFQTSAQARQQFAEGCVDRQPAASPLVMLWGDSFAASIYPGLRALTDGRALDARLAQFTAPLCPPLPKTSEGQLRECEAMNRIAVEHVRIHRPTTVLLAGAWMTYQRSDDDPGREIRGLSDTVRRLKAMGVERVVVVGSLPVWQTAQPRLLLSLWRQNGEVPNRLLDGMAPRLRASEARVEGIARQAGAEFISPVRLLCTDQGCETTIERGGTLYPLAHDEAHLTNEGSRRLALAMLDQLRHGPVVKR